MKRKLSKMKIMLSLSIIVLFLGMASSASAASMSIDPSTKTVSPGETFSINVTVDPSGNAIIGAQFNLKFNPLFVKVNSVTEGNLFKQGGADTNFNRGTINNTTGKVTGVADVITGNNSVNASGTLVIISLTANSTNGTSEIELEDAKVSKSNITLLPININNGTITVGTVVNGNITGKVTNESGSSIQNATVVADSKSDTTDADGNYSISIAPGTYTVTAIATGYFSNSTPGVVVESGDTIDLSFALQPQTFPPLNVTGYWGFVLMNGMPGIGKKVSVETGGVELVNTTSFAQGLSALYSLSVPWEGNFAPMITFKVDNITANSRFADPKGTNNRLDLNVTSAVPQLVVSVTPNTVTVGMPANVTATVTSNSAPVDNATVTLIGAGLNMNATTGLDGIAHLDNVTATSAGTITVTANKTGFTDGTATINASAAGTLTVTTDPAMVTVGMSTPVIATVTSGGAPVQGANVTLSGAGVSMSNTTGSDGKASFNVTATSAGTINVTASKTGSADGMATIIAFVPVRNLTMPVTIKNANSIAGGSVNISFNPSIVNAISATQGDFSGLFISNIDNTTGFVSIASVGTTAVRKSEAILANITFQGVGAGSTTLNLTKASLNTESVPITPSVTNGSITVNAEQNITSFKPMVLEVAQPLSVAATPSTVLVNVPTNVTVNVTSNGTSVPNATVTLSGAGVSMSGTTGSDGKASFNVTATGTGTIKVTASKAGYVSATTDITASSAVQQLVVSVAPNTVMVNVSTNVTVNVTSNGTSVPNATVILSGAGVNMNGTTGVDGSAPFSVTATSGGTITVTASKTGFTDGTTTITVSAPVEVASFKLIPDTTAELKGRSITITINALRSSGELETLYNGKANITIAANNASAVTYPNTTDFTNGIATIQISSSMVQFVTVTATNGSATGNTTVAFADKVFPLNKGWNLISIPNFANPSNVDTALQNVQADAVFEFNTSTGFFMKPAKLLPMYGYWIHVTADNQAIGFIASTEILSVPPSRDLFEGWNLIGVSASRDDPVNISAAVLFSGLKDPTLYNMLFDVQQPHTYVAGIDLTDFTPLMQGHGYWLSIKPLTNTDVKVVKWTGKAW